MSPRSHEDRKCLGQAIRNLREERGLSQAAFARELGIDQSEISKIENGHANPSWGRVARIARALEISLDGLAEEEARIEGRTGWPPRIGDPSAIDVGVRFGRKVRRLREEAGLSQDKLALRCAMRQGSISEIERGRSLPRLDTEVKLTDSLDTSPEELLDGLPSWLPDEGEAGRFSMPDLGEAT